MFKNWFTIFICTISIIITANCSQPKSSKSQYSVVTQNKKIALSIKNRKIEVEIAKTPEERNLGLMYREVLPENNGMLFIFEENGIYPFWMKNTKIPLSIAFISESRTIIDILEMVPNQEVIRYAPEYPFRYALEMNQGWFLKNSINIGDTINGIP